MEFFEKLIYLPSNGLEYDPIVYSKPLGLDFNLSLNDSRLSTSALEWILSVLKSNIGRPIHDMYIHDMFYLWVYVFAENTKSSRYLFKDFCKKCKTVNDVYLHLSELKIKQLNPITDTINLKFDLSEDNYILYRRRKARDAVYFGIKEIELRESDENDELIYHYFCPQIVDIISKNESVPKSSWMDFIKQTMNTKQVHNFFNTVRTPDFGLENELVFTCKEESCKHENHTNAAFDDITFSIINFPEINIADFEKAMSAIMSMSRLPIMDIDQAAKFPILFHPNFTNVAKEMDFQALF